MRTIRLYHFTSHIHAHFIAREGIRFGDTPTSATGGFDHPNLTSDPLPHHQGWAVAAWNKRAVRLTVTLDADDPSLISWPDFAALNRVDPAFYRKLNATGGGGASRWWVYRGVIAPAMLSSTQNLETPTIEEAFFLEVIRRHNPADYDAFLRLVGGRREGTRIYTPRLTFALADYFGMGGRYREIFVSGV